MTQSCEKPKENQLQACHEVLKPSLPVKVVLPNIKINAEFL